MTSSSVEDDLAARRLIARFAQILDDPEQNGTANFPEFFAAAAELVVNGEAMHGKAISDYLSALPTGDWHCVTNTVITRDETGPGVRARSDFGFFKKSAEGWALLAMGTYRDQIERRGNSSVFLRREVRIV